MRLEYNKYKDSAPLETIENIRNILSNLGIFCVEKWLNSAETLYSVNLQVPGTNIASNGKGTSYEFALASGYAELIERLQNNVYFSRIKFKKETRLYNDFFYFSD